MFIAISGYVRACFCYSNLFTIYLWTYSLHWTTGVAFDYCCVSAVTNTHTRLNALCPELPRWADNRKVKPVWISLKQETVSGIDISWAICKSAPHSRQITTPAPHHSVFCRSDALPTAQPTASKHWMEICCNKHCLRKPTYWKLTPKLLSNSSVANFVKPLMRVWRFIEASFATFVITICYHTHLCSFLFCKPFSGIISGLCLKQENLWRINDNWTVF